jgi:hypothetical protein
LIWEADGKFQQLLSWNSQQSSEVAQSVFKNVARLQGSPGVVDFYGGGGNSMSQVMIFAQVGQCICWDDVTRR